MNPGCAVFLTIITLSAARVATAGEIGVRLVDVNSGMGVKNCEVQLILGDPKDRPLPGSTKFLKTSADGRVSFSVAEPLPSLVWEWNDSACAWRCERSAVISVDQILRAGVMTGMGGSFRGEPYCRPNLRKLEEITAKPGEIVVLVRKMSAWERFAIYHIF
jgi:hypothetical protein